MNTEIMMPAKTVSTKTGVLKVKKAGLYVGM
jgi:hypothetical protein